MLGIYSSRGRCHHHYNLHLNVLQYSKFEDYPLPSLILITFTTRSYTTLHPGYIESKPCATQDHPRQQLSQLTYLSNHCAPSG